MELDQEARAYYCNHRDHFFSFGRLISESVGVGHNKQYSVYSVRIYLCVICSSNKDKKNPENYLVFGGCIREPQATVL